MGRNYLPIRCFTPCIPPVYPLYSPCIAPVLYASATGYALASSSLICELGCICGSIPPMVQIPKTMQAVVYRGANDLRLETVPVPRIGPGELLVRVAVCGVCPTDIKKIQYGSVPPPRIFGHETAGTIVRIGSGVRQFRTGERVALHHHVPCLRCHACRHHAFAQCAQYKRTGITAGFEPAGDTVLVAGQGPIGLLFTRLLALRGMRVLATDLLPARLMLARKFGAAEAYCPKSETPNPKAERRQQTDLRSQESRITHHASRLNSQPSSINSLVAMVWTPRSSRCHPTPSRVKPRH